MENLSVKPAIARMIIPLLLSAMAIMYCWWELISVQYIPQWQHYVALVAFIIVLFLFMKDRAIGTVALGIFLLLAITTICSLTYDISSFGFRIGSIPIPLGNLQSWGIFIAYFALNMNALFDYYIDYKEGKVKNRD